MANQVPDPGAGGDPVRTPPTPEPSQPPLPAPAPPGAASAAGLPDWLKFAGGLVIVGGFVTAIGHWSQPAAYGLAFLVVVGFAASGGRLAYVTAFLDQFGFTKGNR